MTTFAERPALTLPTQDLKPTRKGNEFVKWVTTTDHKRIGYMYLFTTFAWFLIAGLLALVLRTELARPGLQFLSNEQYNQIFTMHGTIMLLMFATPLFVGFANVIMPLQIGAADVAFPRLNMLSYWLYLFSGIMVFAGFLTPGGAASFGWTAYAPLSNSAYSPGIGADLWIVGLAVGGIGTILGAVNLQLFLLCAHQV
jgi:cytochrome c oxidase subunit 1